MFFAAIGEIAAAMGALGGYGGAELAWEPLAPDVATTAWHDLPDFPGETADLGIMPLTYASESELRLRWGFWVLENRGLNALNAGS